MCPAQDSPKAQPFPLSLIRTFPELHWVWGSSYLEEPPSSQASFLLFIPQTSSPSAPAPSPLHPSEVFLGGPRCKGLQYRPRSRERLPRGGRNSPQQHPKSSI